MIIGVTAWRGVGATTTAVALATSLATHRPLTSEAGDVKATPPTWLIEADPAGGVLAARFGVPSSSAGTLETLAFGGSRPTVEHFTAASCLLNTGVHVVTAPGEPFRAWGCHSVRAEWHSTLRSLPGQVVVDLGRMHGRTPVGPVLEQLDALILVANADAASVVATTAWLDADGIVTPEEQPRRAILGPALSVVVVDAPNPALPASRTDVVAEVGERFAGWLPWAPSAVDLIHRGAGFDHRRLRHHGFVQAVDHVAARVTAHVNRHRSPAPLTVGRRG